MRGLPFPFGLLVAVALAVAFPAADASAQEVPASADAEPAIQHRIDPPPPPETLPPDVNLDIRGAAIVPLYRDTLCPGDHQCVLNGGVGVSVGVERRWADGWGFLSRYDVWVLDAGALYEIGTMHSVRIGARYVIDATTNVHPYAEALAGFLAFGDTTTVAAVGGSVTLSAGTEIELTDILALDLGAELWTFATSFFATRDGVRRSDGFGANLALQIFVGLEVLLGTF